MLFQGSLTTDSNIRQIIRDHYRCDETQVLENLLNIAEIDAAAKSRAWEYARQLVVNIRKDQKGKGGVDALLNEFSLSTEEGVVLMCLAEALLRVPDSDTIDSLIRDKLAQGDWSSHLGNSESLFVNASSWGLLFTGKLVNYTDERKAKQFGLLKKTVGRLGEPVIRKAVRFAMKIMGTQFVMGHKIDSALERAKEQEAKGYRYSYDMLGEGARTMADADRYFKAYMTAIDAIGRAANNRGPENSPGISIKLSAIHPRYEFSHRERVINELIPRLKQLALAAKAYDIGFTVDAEEANRLDISLDIIEAVFADKALDGWHGFGLAVQAYQRRGLYVIEWARELTQKVGRKMMLRLVKGAYWDSEVKDTQVEGYSDFPVFTRKPSTDVSYQACAKKLLEYRDTIYPQFATHNAYTVATIIEMAKNLDGFEFQRLHGMGDSLYDQVVTNKNIPCRVYAPVGEHSDLLAYLVRRLLENGANSSFVNNIVDDNIPVERLLADPVDVVRAWVHKTNQQIPQSIDLYGESRKNSKGIDLTDVDAITAMQSNMQHWWQQQQADVVKQADNLDEQTKAVTNPANTDEVVGYITHLTEQGMQQAVARCANAFPAWSNTPVTERADILRKTADILEQHRDELIALCTKEAGKNIADGVAEVREAVDFCRYYAHQAEQLMTSAEYASRGVVLCISPWNFPLAIFLGQVSAAIVTGNTVVAKPAEQTSLIALRTVELMHQIGLPDGVIEVVIARGSKVGQVIVPDERVQAIMFTGSTETGSWIAQKLAERSGDPVPLIAETGGQNCMVVDSTALPEQVVDDVISSGFQSAGQRCSALRVLFLQEDVADKIITMIKGAMQELHIGDPSLLTTDVGPVIDDKAHQSLTAHVDYLKAHGTLHYACETIDTAATNHHFFAPRLYEIANLSVLKQEVFGPIVHVIRYKAEQLEQVIEQINGTGFGLTMGIHTRIQAKSEYLAQRSRAGNVYVNRNMIGAVVGVQPFGGRGLSGTGPKAGGPLYLTRLMKRASEQADVELTPEQSAELTQLFEQGKANAYQASNSLAMAESTERLWRETSVTQRCSVMRQLLAAISNQQIKLEHSDNIDGIISVIRRQLTAIEQQLIAPTQLPGPTGESNQLFLEARGILALVRCQQTSFDYWLLALASTLASGNSVLALVDNNYLADTQAIAEQLQQLGAGQIMQVVSFAHLPQTLAATSLAGALVHGASGLKALVASSIAERKGAILPVITETDELSLRQRLTTEKTVTIDTTAAGGNASLMTMTSNVA